MFLQIKNYEVNDNIEVCPCIIEETKKIKDSLIIDYIFKFDKNNVLICFGFCSMYNHSDNSNATYAKINESKLHIKAIKPITKGEEIFINYGTNYWNFRKINKN